MGHFVDWPPKSPPVTIVQCNGAEIFSSARISTELKSSAEILGVMVDADDSLLGRWTRIRGQAISAFPNLPDDLPHEGLIIANTDGRRFGVWIMPDNRTDGMLETFMQWLVPTEHEALWRFVREATEQAQAHGAAYTPAHSDKAQIHALLAWMDPPGESLDASRRRRRSVGSGCA